MDGHNIPSLERALSLAQAYNGPVIVHTVTQKGHGFAPAETDEMDQMHTTSAINPATGKPVSQTKQPRQWTEVFSEELVALAHENDNIIAITAAMADPTGLTPFAQAFPDRIIDVGIAEQHALTMAAGLALGGKHPVVALYSTFLNRAFDQLVMDIGLLSQPVTFVLTRSGITGPDGPSHHGMWDMSLFAMVPGLRLAAPRDELTFREQLRQAVSDQNGPTAIRYPSGAIDKSIPSVHTTDDGVAILAVPEVTNPAQRILIVSVGVMAKIALEVHKELTQAGYAATVIDPQWVVPIASSIIKLSAEHDLVVTIEDGLVKGGIGATLSSDLRSASVDTPHRDIGISQRYLPQGTRAEVLHSEGLTPDHITQRIIAWLT